MGLRASSIALLLVVRMGVGMEISPVLKQRVFAVVLAPTITLESGAKSVVTKSAVRKRLQSISSTVIYLSGPSPLLCSLKLSIAACFFTTGFRSM